MLLFTSQVSPHPGFGAGVAVGPGVEVGPGVLVGPGVEVGWVLKVKVKVQAALGLGLSAAAGLDFGAVGATGSFLKAYKRQAIIIAVTANKMINPKIKYFTAGFCIKFISSLGWFHGPSLQP